MSPGEASSDGSYTSCNSQWWQSHSLLSYLSLGLLPSMHLLTLPEFTGNCSAICMCIDCMSGTTISAALVAVPNSQTEH